jgi:hypothetical protein
MEVSRQVSRPFTCHTPIIEIGLRPHGLHRLSGYGGPLRAASATRLVLTSQKCAYTLEELAGWFCHIMLQPAAILSFKSHLSLQA